MCIHALAWHVKHSSQFLKKKKPKKTKQNARWGKVLPLPHHPPPKPKDRS